MTQQKMLEAALFMSARPLMLDELGKILGVHSMGYVKEMLEKLQKDYAGRGMEIVSTPQGWVMQVRQELLGKVSHLTPYADISEGCKRSLAIIAYKEPVQQSEIIRIQGNKAYTYLKHLQKRNLIKAEKKGRTKIIRLTPEFERYFGEEKESIKERLESSQNPEKASAKAKESKKAAAGRSEKPKAAEAPPAKESKKAKPAKQEKKPESQPAKEGKPSKADVTHILE
jgi:segregation and condensation protein B